MGPRLAFHIAPIELMQSLKRDDTTLLDVEPFGNFLPRFALLALCADEINERLKATAIRSPAAALPVSPISGFRIHAMKLRQKWIEPLTSSGRVSLSSRRVKASSLAGSQIAIERR